MISYYADIQFTNDKGKNSIKHEDKTTIQFNANRENEAGASVLRWIKNRQKAFSEFGGVFSVRIGVFILHTIDDNGYLASDRMNPFFDWHLDGWMTDGKEKQLEDAVKKLR